MPLKAPATGTALCWYNVRALCGQSPTIPSARASTIAHHPARCRCRPHTVRRRRIRRRCKVPISRPGAPAAGRSDFFFNCLARPRFWSPAPFPPLPLFTPSIATPRAPRPAADQTQTACLIHCWQPTTQKQPVLWKLSFASFVRDCKPVPLLFFFVQNHVTKVSVCRKPLSPSLTSHASSWPWLFSCCRPRILHFRSQSTGSPPPLLFSNPDVEPCPKDLAVRPLVCVSLTRSPPPCEQSHSPRYCLQLPALPRSTRV